MKQILSQVCIICFSVLPQQKFWFFCKLKKSSGEVFAKPPCKACFPQLCANVSLVCASEGEDVHRDIIPWIFFLCATFYVGGGLRVRVEHTEEVLEVVLNLPHTSDTMQKKKLFSQLNRSWLFSTSSEFRTWKLKVVGFRRWERERDVKRRKRNRRPDEKSLS